jgi:hypothetical protein
MDREDITYSDTNGAELVDYGNEPCLLYWGALGFLVIMFWSAVIYAVGKWCGAW